jgi:hypothetical protein
MGQEGGDLIQFQPIPPDHSVRDGLGTSGVLAREFYPVISRPSWATKVSNGRVGEGVFSTTLVQVVLQTERDGLAAQREPLF